MVDFSLKKCERVGDVRGGGEKRRENKEKRIGRRDRRERKVSERGK